MQKKSTHQGNTSTLNRTLLDDDRALEIIELTLYKYQQFLDFLRNAGFGKLIEYSEINQEQQEQRQKQKQSGAGDTKSANSRSKSSTLKNSSKSPNSKSPISDEQRYYLSKISKTKSKLMNDSYQLYANNTFGNSKSIFDASNSTAINYENDTNMNIDTLLSNALEISRSYRRMNSSSLNNTTLNAHNYNRNARGLTTNNEMLSEIEEANRETSAASLTLNNESILPNIEELQKTTETLLEQYKNIKSKENNNSNNSNNKEKDDVSQESSKKSVSKKQAINSVTLSPEKTKKVSNYNGSDTGEIGKNLFLFAENLQDASQASLSENNNNQNNNGSTSSPPTTIVINKPSQPPAVSARSISSVSNTKRTSASEQMSNEKRQPSVKSYSNDDFEAENDEDEDETENLVLKRDFMKKSTLSREDFDVDGVDSYNEEDDDF
jgi:hypothetical protein